MHVAQPGHVGEQRALRTYSCDEHHGLRFTAGGHTKGRDNGVQQPVLCGGQPTTKERHGFSQKGRRALHEFSGQTRTTTTIRLSSANLPQRSRVFLAQKYNRTIGWPPQSSVRRRLPPRTSATASPAVSAVISAVGGMGKPRRAAAAVMAASTRPTTTPTPAKQAAVQQAESIRERCGMDGSLSPMQPRRGRGR